MTEGEPKTNDAVDGWIGLACFVLAWGLVWWQFGPYVAGVFASGWVLGKITCTGSHEEKP